MHILCPLDGFSRLVESLPRDGLADGHFESLVDIAVHLIYQEEHRDVHFEVEGLAYIGNPIKTVGVVPAEMDGHHIPMSFYALGDECLAPRHVSDNTLGLA